MTTLTVEIPLAVYLLGIRRTGPAETPEDWQTGVAEPLTRTGAAVDVIREGTLEPLARDATTELDRTAELPPLAHAFDAN